MTTFAMTGFALYDALTNVLPHVNGDASFPVLNAVEVTVDDAGLVTFVATDRYTLCAVEACSHPNRELEPGTFLIPADVARAIAKNAKTVRGGCATVTHAAPGVITTALDTGETSTARDQQGEFPRWRSLWPTGDPAAVERIGLGAAHLAKFAKLSRGARAVKMPTLDCSFYGAAKTVLVAVVGLDIRALVMPTRLGDK